MAGTLNNLGPSQWFDPRTNVVAQGAKLTIYQAGTLAKVDVWANTGLTIARTNPMVANSYGVLPAFWLEDGTYRARLTTADGGLILLDEDNMFSIGLSAGEGGGGDTVDTTAIFATGDMLFGAVDETRAGWVRMNGRTIGSASSGASERANADTEPLYLYLWNKYGNNLIPVSGGRGANAAADYAANKALTLFDMRNKSVFGLSDMGNSTNNGLNGITFAIGDQVTPGSQGGAATWTLSENELPVHDHGDTSSVNISHDHDVDVPLGFGTVSQAAGTLVNVWHGTQTGTTDAESVPHAHATGNAGGGLAHGNMPPFILGTWFQKL